MLSFILILQFCKTFVFILELPLDKTNKMACVPSEDSDQPGERGGSVVECLTPEREVGGLKPTAAMLCP